eukprot:TRINITY_DN8033_c0_g1_i1.p1 TRINITY_DN8033_c0_g1~~TRINITY_DN8033_c0_g1_i1.p1  ORF type:complete len:376 (-),score=36.48 TRINITY_DN8033_c0_g1_i1:201-1232(-)
MAMAFRMNKALMLCCALRRASSLEAAAETCASDIEQDEVGFLQNSGPTRSPVKLHGYCKDECQNGGHCVPGFNFCLCKGGWRGPDCSTPTDLMRDEIYHLSGRQAQCNMHVEIFPYMEADLWGTAYQGWEKCAGKAQSPVNLQRKSSEEKVQHEPLATNYSLSHHEDYVENTGHGLEMKGNFGTLTIEGVVYASSQFHFHHPSEHRVHGRQAAMEMHIVHSNNAGVGAVVGILFDLGEENECLKSVLSAPAPRAGCEKQVPRVDLRCFREQLTGNYWSYTGSLTTPPCSEGILWTVMERRATISQSQLDVFKSRYHMNARPTQPLNGRKETFHRIDIEHVSDS